VATAARSESIDIHAQYLGADKWPDRIEGIKTNLAEKPVKATPKEGFAR